MTIPQYTPHTPRSQGWRNQKWTSPSPRTPKSSGNGKWPAWTRVWGRRLFRWGLIAVGVGIVAIIALFIWVSRDLPDPGKIIDRQVVESTKIYDRTGKILLYDIHNDVKRTSVQLSDIPEHLKQATIVTEDKNFYKHRGFSLTGIIRSAIVELMSGGSHAQGGSTITQQFVKNAILSREKTYTRKLKELILSFQIERRFTKDEILNLYFNEIPYGSVAYGAQAASQTFFGKDVKDVSLAEAAILAALPQAPTSLSPYGANTDRLFQRQHFILDSMVEAKVITTEQAEAAKQEPVVFKERTENIKAPHFVMYVRELLTKEFGETVVETQGLKVVTTLDYDLQLLAEKEIAARGEKNEKDFNATNAALVSLDPKTGQILAMVGSRDYNNVERDGNVNVAVRPRQPGSSFKPIVYLASFMAGYTPKTIVFDLETSFKTETGAEYRPRNYSLNENGPVSLRMALQGSLNIPAVKLIYLTGIDRVLDLADSMGYTTLQDRSRFGLSLVLGGGEVTLLEHVAAFGAMAQDGTMHQTAAFLEVRDRGGNMLKEYKDDSKRVVEEQPVRQINNVLSDNNARAYVFGTTNSLTLPDRVVAAKTGTTNDYHDAWTIGYTPNLVTGVWVGNNDNSVMKRGADGSVVAAPIWQAFMTEAVKDLEKETFPSPKEEKTGKSILDGEMAAEVKVRIDRVSGKLATEYTPAEDVEERTYREVHNILHYVEKTNPRGAVPGDPTKDPHYANWEEPVQRWAATQGYSTQAPPTEKDDVHFGDASGPDFLITQPEFGARLTDPILQVTVDDPDNNVAQVKFYFNDQFMGALNSPPYTVNYDVSIYEPGFHRLTIVAFDHDGQARTKTVEVNIGHDQPRPDVLWNQPADATVAKFSNFPIGINVDISVVEKISKININAVDSVSKRSIPVAFKTSPTGNEVLQWQTAPSPGTYQLQATLLDRQGRPLQFNGPTVTVTK